MKRCATFILGVVLFLNAITPGWADLKAVQDYANRQTWLNNVTDSLATMGESKAEKSLIKAQRRAARRKARLQKLQEENSHRANGR